MGKKSSRVCGGSPALAAVDVPAVVLDAGAHADLGQHLQVVGGPHPEPLGLEQLALGLEPGQPFLQLGLDPADGDPHPLVAGHVVGGREDHQLVRLGQLLAGQGVQGRDALDLVAEQLDPDRVLLVGRVDLDGVAAHPELPAHQVGVVALVLHVDQPAQDGPLVLLGAPLHVQDPVGVLLRRSQAVDAADRGHHDDVPPGQQGRGGRVAEPIDLVVDRAVLLDVGVARRAGTPRAGSSRSS